MSLFKSWVGQKHETSNTMSAKPIVTETKIVRTIDTNGLEVVKTYVNGQLQSTVETQGPIPTSSYRAALTQNSKKPPQIINSGSFEKECLDEHNRLRALHGCPPLTLNRKISNFSAVWAKNLAKRNIFEHRKQTEYGENLYMATNTSIDGKTAVKAWYDEIKDYRFNPGGYSSATGHFTQLIWKSAKEMGVAVEQKGNSIYVVVNYTPPGNYTGQYIENVPQRLN